jgi:ribosomal protein S18 acetylase RimI-like enzyme
MIKTRPVSPSDLILICNHRDAMFTEAGKPAPDVAAMSPSFAAWLQPRLEDGRYFGFIAESLDGVPVAGVGLMEIDWPPHPSHPYECRRGYVLNVYVDPSHRGQGIARALMEKSDEAFRERTLSYAILHATDAGRPLYEGLGWSQTSEMAKQFN